MNMAATLVGLLLPLTLLLIAVVKSARVWRGLLSGCAAWQKAVAMLAFCTVALFGGEKGGQWLPQEIVEILSWRSDDGVLNDVSGNVVSGIQLRALEAFVEKQDQIVDAASNVIEQARAECAALTNRLLTTDYKVLEGKMGANEIRNRMQHRLEQLDYAPDAKDTGGLRDLSSDARTNLIIDMQEQRARGYAVWRSQQSEPLLKVWPANEMFRAAPRKVPRDWKARWNAARAAIGEASTTATYALTQDGPFIALKNDPIWSTVSRFGSPWPPFDYQSGMRLKQVKASAARASGVLKPGAEGPKPARDPMRRVESASCSGMSEPIVRQWAEAFGDRARIVDGRVFVCPDKSVVAEVLEAAAGGAKAQAVFSFVPPSVRARIDALFPRNPLRDATAFELDADHVRHVERRHGEGAERQKDQRPIVLEDFLSLPETLKGPGTWRRSTPAEKGTFRGDAITHFAASGLLTAWKISRNRTTPHLSLITMLAKRKVGGARPPDVKTPGLRPDR